MKKKTLAAFLALALTVGLASCNGTVLPTVTTTSSTPTPTVTTTSGTTTTVEPLTTTTVEPLTTTTGSSVSTSTTSITTTTTTTSQVNETYTVTWKNYDGTELEVDRNVSKGSTPSFDSTTPVKAEDANNTYTFAGWSPALTGVTANATYTATFTANPKSNYTVIEDTVKEIPTNLTFTGEASGVTANLEISSLNVGTYSDKNFMTGGGNLDGVYVSAYRAVSGDGYVTIKPDSYFYKDTPYHGHEGAIFNSNAIGGINSIEITYKTTDAEASGKKNPNVTFGNSLECDNYLYYLDPSSNDNTVTINVNNSNFKYFSINTGDYTTKVSNVVLNCDSKSGTNADARAASGEGKYRVNPVSLDRTKLVAGQTKVTLPTNIAYDSVTKTYSATSSKTLTYYTLDFVEDHPSVKQDATITDPMEVCMYYTTFGTWPANYGTNLNAIKAVFGNDTRKVSSYNRKNGYATSVPFNDNGNFVYYELDINYDGNYTTGSRGTGRVVAWDLGFTTTGYTKAPVCVYTDDHYNTWLEYYNNGTWSNRFNGEGIVTGVKYSAPTTVELTGFDYNIVAGDPNTPIPAETGSETVDIDMNTSTDLTADDLLYYANFAPVEILNGKTAVFQKVTNMRGIIEDAKYVIVTRTDHDNVYAESDYNGADFQYGDNNSLVLREGYDNYDYVCVYGFEKIGDNEYRMYRSRFFDANDSSRRDYLKYENKSGKDLSYGEGTFKLGFKDGNFILVCGGYTYQYNPERGGYFRTYTVDSQQPIQLYRYCDVYADYNLVTNSDIKTDETSRYRKATFTECLFEGSEYLIACAANNMCLTDDPDNVFYQAFNQLYTDSDSFAKLSLMKHNTEDLWALAYIDWNANVYFIGVEDNKIVLDAAEPTMFNVTFDNAGNVLIAKDNYLLGYGARGFDFYSKTEEVEAIQLYRLCGNADINPKPIDPNMPENAVIFDHITSLSEISSDKKYIVSAEDAKKSLTSYAEAYVNKKEQLAISKDALESEYGFPYVYFAKHDTYNIYAMYVIEKFFGDSDWVYVPYYFCAQDNSDYLSRNEELTTYFEIIMDQNGGIKLIPCKITDSGIEYYQYYDSSKAMLAYFGGTRNDFLLMDYSEYTPKLFIYEVNLDTNTTNE